MVERLRGTPPGLGWRPPRRWHVIRQQCLHTPALIGDPGGHRRCRRPPTAAKTRVWRTKLRDRAAPIPSVLERQWTPRPRPPSPGQHGQAFAACDIEPLEVGRMDHPVAARAVPERLDVGGCAIHEAAVAAHDSPLGLPLHDLRHAEVAPATPPRAPLPPGLHGITTGLTKRPSRGAHAVGTQHEGAVRCPAAQPRQEPSPPGPGALDTDCSRAPHAGTDPQRQGHPDAGALGLHAALVGWHRAQMTWLRNQRLLDSLPLRPGACPPRRHRPCVAPESRDARLPRTARREPCPHGHDPCSRRTQPVADGAFRRGNGFVALLTDKPLLLARVDSAMALTDLASGRTCQVRAAYGVGSMRVLLSWWCWGACPEGVSPDPISVTRALLHG